MIHMSIEEILAFYAGKAGTGFAVAVPLDELRALQRAHDIYKGECERRGWTAERPPSESGVSA